MKNLDYTFVFISLCISQLSTLSEGRPLRKRTVSEVQLMHNLGEHKQVQERREWLQSKLHMIHMAPGPHTSPALRSGPRPEELPDLSKLTPEQIQVALNFLEKFLKSNHT